MRKPERCWDWPSCGCGRRWRHWSEFDPSEWVWTPEQVEDVRADLVFMLVCVAQYCPDVDKRQHATRQLKRSAFAKEAREWRN